MQCFNDGRDEPLAYQLACRDVHGDPPGGAFAEGEIESGEVVQCLAQHPTAEGRSEAVLLRDAHDRLGADQFALPRPAQQRLNAGQRAVLEVHDGLVGKRERMGTTLKGRHQGFAKAGFKSHAMGEILLNPLVEQGIAGLAR